MDSIVGKHDHPVSVFDSSPALSNAVTSPWTALTSRSTRRAASRMDMAPAPVIAFSNSQRLPDNTLNSSSGDSKLMRGAEALLPLFHVWVKSPSVSGFEPQIASCSGAIPCLGDFLAGPCSAQAVISGLHFRYILLK